MSILSQTTAGCPRSNNIVLKCAFSSFHLNFAHINLGTFRKYKSEIELLFAGTKLDLLAVSETWLNSSVNDNLIKLNGFSLFRHDRLRPDVQKGGGLAFFVRCGLETRIIAKSRKNALTEYLFIEIANNSNEKILFGVVYNPPRKNKFDSLDKAIENITRHYSNVIVLGDFNLDPRDTDRHSINLNDIFTSKGFSLINSEPTNFSSTINPTLIDLCWSSNVHLVKRFSQLSMGAISTHDMIFGTADFLPSVTPNIQTKVYRDFYSPSSETLSAAAAALNWAPLYELNDIDDQVLFLSEQLNSVIHEAVPVKTLRIDNRFSRPVNNKLQFLMHERNFHHLAARNEKDALQKAIHIAAYKRLRNKVTSLKNKCEKKKTS